MTQEEKQLLLKDLCARLSYGVIVDYKENEFEIPHWKITTIYPDTFDGWIGYDKRVGAGSESGSRPFKIGEVKPYLRPLSSITEGELMEFGRLKYQDNEIWEIVEMRVVKHDFLNIKCRNKHDGVSTWVFQISRTEPLRSWKGIDWLNEHHFDYRGLIPMGLALEAPDGMYKTE